VLILQGLEEQKALVPRIVESITFTPTEIEIALFDHMIERGLLIPPTVNHFSNGALECSKWLPGLMSQSAILWDNMKIGLERIAKGHAKINLL